MRLPFQAAPTSSAVLSECGAYRYTLGRRWGAGRPLCWVMLNPSTADAAKNDPTIRRCIGFSKSAGYGALVVVNLFAYRSTSPEGLWLTTDPVGPKNDQHLLEQVERCGVVLCAWGSSGGKLARERATQVEAMLRETSADLRVLRLSKYGIPRHPLYLPGSLRPVPWPGGAP